MKQTGQYDATVDDTAINDADDRDEDDGMRCNDRNREKIQKDHDDGLNNDDSVINHRAKEPTDGFKNQNDDGAEIIDDADYSDNKHIDENGRKKDNDTEMSNDDDSGVLDKIHDNERLRFIDEIVTYYS